jgi:hypothetical protein
MTTRRKPKTPTAMVLLKALWYSILVPTWFKIVYLVWWVW